MNPEIERLKADFSKALSARLKACPDTSRTCSASSLVDSAIADCSPT